MTPEYGAGNQDEGLRVSGDLTLKEAMIGAAEAPGPQRIEFRDPIAKFGAEAVVALEPWLHDPALAAFAVRTIVRTAAFGAQSQARRALVAAMASPISPVIAADLQSAIAVVGGTPRPKASGPAKRASRPTMPTKGLAVGRVYRRRDLHDGGWGGNRQSGISYPANGEHVLLFSDPAKAKEHGYRDRWTPDGIYHYYGEWSGTGDMTLSGGNQAILDRSPELHLFIAAPGGHRYEGHFECVGHEPEVTVRDNREFRAIVFLLRRLD
jgi:hypothetical protein